MEKPIDRFKYMLPLHNYMKVEIEISENELFTIDIPQYLDRQSFMGLWMRFNEIEKMIGKVPIETSKKKYKHPVSATGVFKEYGEFEAKKLIQWYSKASKREINAFLKKNNLNIKKLRYNLWVLKKKYNLPLSKKWSRR